MCQRPNYFEEIIDKMMINDVAEFDNSIKETLLSLPLNQKRLAILSILDKNRDLFTKIRKTITENNISKTEYVKQVVEMLREYVKVGDVEKKKYGEVMTPIHLVEDMMDTLPIDVWSNPDLKWLDPCAGVGVFSAVIINRLMKGLENVILNDEERYKHIVEKMLYITELQPKNMFLYLVAFDPEDKYFLNVFTGSYLSEEFDNHCKNEWGVEKFDVVVMNPPFNTVKQNSTLHNKEKGTTNTGALYVNFVEKGLKSSNKLFSCILPSVWTGDPKRKITKLIMNNGLYFASDSSYFGMDITQSTCFVCLDKTNKLRNGYIIKNLKDKWVCKNYNIIPIKSNSVVDKIIEKTEKYRKLSEIWQRSCEFPRNKLGQGKDLIVEVVGSVKQLQPNFSTIDGSFSKQDHYSKWKIVVNCVGFFPSDEKRINKETFKLCPPNCFTSSSIVSFGVTTETEAINLLSYLQTDFVSFLINQFKIMPNNSLTVYQNIPLVDLSKSWINEEVLDYFELTEDEKQAIKI